MPAYKMIKTIVQVFGSLDAGGAESRMMDVFRAIDRTKYKFIFISLDTKSEQFYEKDILSLGGKIIKISSPRDVGIIRHFKEMVSVFRHLYNQGANVIHSHTSYHSGLVLTAARIAGFKIRIAHARTTSSINKNSLSQRLQIWIGKYLIKMNATSRLALNDETAVALFGKKSDGKNILVIPNAINLERYRLATPASDLSNIPTTSTVIGHIGRFQPMKNHKFVIDFFTEFKKRHDDSYLILVGDGPLLTEIQEYVNVLGIGKYVKFLGLRKDVPNILKRINLFLFPSLFEGLGGSVIEAQASGIPCLVSDSLPRNVDMGLQLVKFYDLNEPFSSWVAEAEQLLTLHKSDFEYIYNTFNDKGFTLDSEIKQLTAIYENSNNNNNDIQ